MLCFVVFIYSKVDDNTPAVESSPIKNGNKAEDLLNNKEESKNVQESESNTTFVKGTYTLAYLTELQAKISTAMVNKELPFVTMSGVYETSNNIIVNVTTNDEAELAKVYAIEFFRRGTSYI